MLLDIMNHAFLEGDQLPSAYEAVEGVSENLKVAVFHKNLENAVLRKHLLRSAATLDSVTSIRDEVVSCSLAEAVARGTVPMDVDQVNMIKAKRKTGKGGKVVRASGAGVSPKGKVRRRGARVRVTSEGVSSVTAKDTSNQTVLRRQPTRRRRTPKAHPRLTP